MIAVDKGAAIGQVVFCAMDEFVIGEARAGLPDDAVMSDLAERQYDFQFGQTIQRFDEIRSAIIDLCAGWFVFRWQAFDRVEDDRLVQFDSIRGIIGKLTVNKAIFGQSGEQHFA